MKDELLKLVKEWQTLATSSKREAETYTKLNNTTAALVEAERAKWLSYCADILQHTIDTN